VTELPLLVSLTVTGYLLGSIPIANIVMHLFTKQDLRRLGTGNVTSTAVFICAGRLPGAMSLLGEVSKTFLILFVAHLVVNELWAYLVILVATAAGQIWSIWLKGAGGRGQTIFVTGFLALCPIPFLLAALVFLLLFFATKRLHLSNQVFHLVTPFALTLANVFNPAMFGLGEHSWGYSVVGAMFAGLFFLKHRRESDDIIKSRAWGAYSR